MKGEEIRSCYRLLPSHFLVQYGSEEQGKLYFFFFFGIVLSFPFISLAVITNCTFTTYVDKVQSAKAEAGLRVIALLTTMYIHVCICVYMYIYIHTLLFS